MDHHPDSPHFARLVERTEAHMERTEALMDRAEDATRRAILCVQHGLRIALPGIAALEEIGAANPWGDWSADEAIAVLSIDAQALAIEIAQCAGEVDDDTIPQRVRDAALRAIAEASKLRGDPFSHKGFAG
jgi:hypothetical protein